MSTRYWDGIDQFLTFAFTGLEEGSMISCPCRICTNRNHFSRIVVREHLIYNGFLRKYKNWTHYGEPYVPLCFPEESVNFEDRSVQDHMVEMIREGLGIPDFSTHDNIDDDNSSVEHTPYDTQSCHDEQTNKYFKLLEGARTGLFPGCKKFSVLSFIVRLLHIKVLNGWSDKSFTMLLDLLKEAFPDGVKLPNSYYEAQKITTDLGFTYETVDACPNDCMLFKNNDAHLEKCLICESARYKQDLRNLNNVEPSGKKVAIKKVRYFPLKPRLQRLFMSSKTTGLMRWHAEERVNDGVFRHPADCLAWKDFDERHSHFSSEVRNVRLGLASDGFNPFRTISTNHSTWPVVLIPYNLPPWLCMKQPSLILSMLIDGPRLGEVYYYGSLVDIIEIQYTNQRKYVLFKCDWVDSNVGKKQDRFKFTLVNFKKLLYQGNHVANEPFILASQAEQVWYVSNPLEPDWCVVVKMSPRDLIDMPVNQHQIEPYVNQQIQEVVNINDEDIAWVRNEIDGQIVEGQIEDEDDE